MRISIVLSAVLGCALIASCSKDQITAPAITAAELCANEKVLISNLQPYPTIDEMFEVMSRLLPGGFGGLTTNYWYLKQTTLADTARATAHVLAGCPGDQMGNLWQIVQEQAVRQGRYDWVQLRGWYAQLISSASSTQLITADIDEGRNRLAFTFTTQAALDAFRAKATQLAIPDDALSLAIGTPPRLGTR